MHYFRGLFGIQTIKVEKGKWIADPFLVENDGQTYLFVEYYIEKKKKASIAYYRFEKDEPIFGSVIIDEPYHLSYPCYFEMNNKKYILPESSAGNVLSLYECDSFPDSWHKKCDLIKGQKVVDSTVFKDESGTIHVFSYKKQGAFFNLDHYILNNDYSLSFIDSMQFKDNVGRPAGLFFYKGNSLYRPAQNCKRVYGESLLFYKVLLSENSFTEELTESEITIDSILVDGKYDRIHTFCSTNQFEVVDLFKEKFDLFRSIKIFVRSHKTK